MARARAEVDQHKLIDGKWFCRTGDWILPYSRPALSALRVRQRFVRTTTQNAYQSIDARKPREVLRKVRRLYREINQRKTMLYNAQPRWSLSDIEVKSLSQATELINEFLRFVEFAAAEFCWMADHPRKPMEWRKHAWKHITFSDIENVLQEVNKSGGLWLPPELRLDLIGSFEEAQQLFQAAERCEPEAVARLDFLFRLKDDKDRAARHVLELNSRKRTPYIPSSGALAAEWVTHAVTYPDSEEAETARSRLKRLASIQAAKGSRREGGRPSATHHHETVVAVWMMAYAISKQLREVDRFLRKHAPNEQQRRTQLDQSYPWVSRVIGTNCSEFLKYGNTQNALQLAGKLLGVSASKVQKTIYAPSLS